MNLDPEVLRHHRREIGATLSLLAERSRLSIGMLGNYEARRWGMGTDAMERVRGALVQLARERRSAASVVLRRFRRRKVAR